MPDAKRRKRKQRERARGGTREASRPSGAAAPVRPTAQPMPLPSPTARATGFVIAVITAFLGGLVIYNAIRDQTGAAAITQVVGGVLLMGIALVVAALVAIRERIRAMLSRRRR